MLSWLVKPSIHIDWMKALDLLYVNVIFCPKHKYYCLIFWYQIWNILSMLMKIHSSSTFLLFFFPILLDMTNQGLKLTEQPHIVVTTPGRLADHLESCKTFNFKRLRFLVSLFPFLKEMNCLLDLLKSQGERNELEKSFFSIFFL